MERPSLHSAGATIVLHVSSRRTRRGVVVTAYLGRGLPHHHRRELLRFLSRAGLGRGSPYFNIAACGVPNPVLMCDRSGVGHWALDHQSTNEQHRVRNRNSECNCACSSGAWCLFAGLETLRAASHCRSSPQSRKRSSVNNPSFAIFTAFEAKPRLGTTHTIE
jgi:hypothetical protein